MLGQTCFMECIHMIIRYIQIILNPPSHSIVQGILGLCSRGYRGSFTGLDRRHCYRLYLVYLSRMQGEQGNKLDGLTCVSEFSLAGMDFQWTPPLPGYTVHQSGRSTWHNQMPQVQWSLVAARDDQRNLFSARDIYQQVFVSTSCSTCVSRGRSTTAQNQI